MIIDTTNHSESRLTIQPFSLSLFLSIFFNFSQFNVLAITNITIIANNHLLCLKSHKLHIISLNNYFN